MILFSKDINAKEIFIEPGPNEHERIQEFNDPDAGRRYLNN